MGRQENQFYPQRYPLHLDLQYKMRGLGKMPALVGCGRTTAFGSRELTFAGDQPVATGANLEISVAWPALLHGRVRLQLVIQGRVVQVGQGRVTVAIGKYHFRTRGLASSGAPQPARAESPSSAPPMVRAAAWGAHA